MHQIPFGMVKQEMYKPVYYCKSSALAQVLIVLMGLVAFTGIVQGNATGQIYLRVETTSADTDIYTASVYQNATEAPAATLVLFLIYDSSKATLLPDGASGSYVQLAQQQQEAGFVISETLHAALDNMDGKSCMAIAIYKTNDRIGLNPGELISFQLQIDPDADDATPVLIQAATAAFPVYLSGTALVSSASTADEISLPVNFEPASIARNCVPPPSPENVKASRRYKDKIIITWEPPQYSNPLEYKVYRGISDNIDEAIHLDMSNIGEYTWTDSFDTEALIPPPAGCNCTLAQYYYWVRAKDTITGCLSKFSDPPARGSLP